MSVPMNEIKYICIGGEVVSETDGDRHWVNAHEVARLYGVDNYHCLIDLDSYHRSDLSPELIVLGPDPTGAYELNHEE